MSLISLSEYELYNDLTISDPSGAEGQKIENYIYSAQKFMENYCNRYFESSIYTERYSLLNASTVLYLRQAPVTDLTSIQLVNVDGTVITTYSSSDYYLNEDGSIYYMYGFPAGKYHLKVIYTAGYAEASIPYDLKMICAKLAYNLQNSKFGGNKKSESLGDYSYTLRDEASKNSEISSILNDYILYFIEQ